MKIFSAILNRRGLAAGVAAVVLGVAALGVAAAQQTPTTSPSPSPGQTAQQQPTKQSFMDALAKRLGITTDALQQAISQARTDVGLPAGKAGNGFGPGGPGGFRGPGGHGFGGRGLIGQALNVAAQAIGISTDQLRQELPGKSLTQVAQAHGKNPTDVANALKNAGHQRVDQAVDQLMTRVFPQPGQQPQPAQR